MESQEKRHQLDSRYERWRWQTFAITWTAYAGFYLTRKSFSVAKIEMGSPEGLGMSDEQMAWIDFGYLLCYAIGQFVWGICGDRFGTRRVVLVGMLASVVAAFAMGASTSVIALGSIFAIQGLCQSTGWAPLTKNVSNFFSQRERGTVMGVWCTNFAVGGLVASVYAGFSADYFGDYRYAFFVPAVTLFCIWLLFVLLQRDRPEDVGLPPIEEYHHEVEAVLDENETPEEEPEGSWKVISEVITNPMVVRLAAVYFFLKPARYAILFWGPKYLNEKLDTGMMESGALGALFELAGPLSLLLGGLVSDKLLGSRRMPVIVTCLFILSVLLFSIDKVPETRLVLGACFFFIGLFLYAPDGMISGTAAIDFGTKKGASTAAGLINGFGSCGAILGGTLPGLLNERWGWDGVFTALGIATLIAGCLLLPRWNALPNTAGHDATSEER